MTQEAEAAKVPEKVEFKHPFFTAVKGSFFRMIDETDTPVMVTPLETGAVDLRFTSVKRELKLDDEDPDWKTLELVGQALRYVKGIRVGDPFPSELRSGEPSWEVTEKHRKIAQSRVSMQLVTWMSGDEEVMTDADQLAQIADDPAMKEKINEAFAEAAEKLGLDRENRDEVVNLVSGLAEELACIEAIRERLEHVRLVESRMKELASIYKAERGTMENIIPVNKLIVIAMRGFDESLEEIDAQTGEIMAVLRNMALQVKFIREKRDDMHRRLWAWDDIVQKWEHTPARRSIEAEKMIMETYHFLAQRFLPQKQWELFTKAQERAQNTESVWG